MTSRPGKTKEIGKVSTFTNVRLCAPSSDREAQTRQFQPNRVQSNSSHTRLDRFPMSIIYPAGKALTYLPILFLLDGPRKKVMCDVSDRPVGIGTRLNQTELEEDYARFQPIRASHPYTVVQCPFLTRVFGYGCLVCFLSFPFLVRHFVLGIVGTVVVKGMVVGNKRNRESFYFHKCSLVRP